MLVNNKAEIIIELNNNLLNQLENKVILKGNSRKQGIRPIWHKIKIQMISQRDQL